MPELSGSTYSETDASNNSASPNGMPEGMAPSGVNDSWRAGMGAVKRFHGRVNPVYNSTGSANAYVLTYTSALAAYVDGEVYSFQANFANTGAATLNISGLGAKTIKKMSGAAKADLAANDIISGMPVQCAYDGTDMVLLNPTANYLSASVSAASTSASGIIELATQAEVDTGTDTVRAVVPSTLTGWTPGVASVTFDPSADEALIRDASASNVLKRANINTLISGTEAATTSGSTVDFTGIPSWAKRITVMFNAVSTNGSSPICVQLGDSGGIETSGYTATGAQIVNAAAVAAVSQTAGFPIHQASNAADGYTGVMTIVLENAASFRWVANYVGTSNNATANMTFGAGVKATSAALDRIRITMISGADTFDAGAVNILYD